MQLSDLCFFITEWLKLAAMMDVTSSETHRAGQNLIMVLSEWVRHSYEVKI